MIFKSTLVIACALAVHGGVVQQQTLAVPAAAGPLATSYRFDRPLQDQLSSGPLVATAHAASYPAPVAAPFASSLAVAPAISREAPVAAAPLVKTIAAAPVAKTVVAEEYDANPQYSFSYDVHDTLTGDSKNQVESRDGDVVQGSYSLNEPDGTRRIVEYTADPVNGFNAVVRREPQVAKAAVVAAPAVTKIAAPVAAAAPAVAKITAPVALGNAIYH